MGLEVEFITLGEASVRLDVPSATLRNWTDQMEEYDVHYVMRNNRNERIYYEEDIEIFKFIRDLKKEHGRKTTTKDLSYILKEKGEEGEYTLRTKEEAPSVTLEPSNRTAELLNQEDIKRLMESERVRQFVSLIFKENSEGIKKDIVRDITEEMRNENKELKETIEELKRVQEETNRLMQAQLDIQKKAQDEKPEPKKGIFAMLFGGK